MVVRNDNDELTIEITIGTILKIALMFFLFWLVYYLQHLVLIILTSVVIASALEPMTVWLMNYKIPRVPAVIIIYVVVFALVLGLLVWFFPLVFDDLFRLVNTIPQYIRLMDFDQYVSSGPARILNDFKDGLASSATLEDLFPIISDAAGRASTGVIETAKYFFGGIFSLILLVVISFYLSVQERGIENFLRLVSHIKYEKYIIDLWKRSQRKIGYWMQGQVLLGLLIGVFVYLGLSVLGVPYALALAIFASIFEVIPIFGPILAAAPGIVIAFTESPTLGFMTFGFYVIIQQFENHLIYPLVVRKIVGVPPLLVILAIIIGFEIAGFWGVILSVPGSAVLMELADDIAQHKKLFAREE